MARSSRDPLLVAAALCFGIALLHVGVVFGGPSAYVYFAAPELGAAEARGSPVPDRITWVLVAAFGLCGHYALAGARRARWRPPLLAWGLVAIGAVFTLRGLLLGPELVALARPDASRMGAIPPRYAVFSLVSLVTGLATLLGTRRAWSALRAGRGARTR
jgi:hypothetical protein